MGKPQLIADVELMKSIRKEKNIPKDGFKIQLDRNELARLIYTFYVESVQERYRAFQESQEINDTIFQIAEILTSSSYRFGIIISGPCGNGKTTLMIAIRKTLCYLYMRRTGCISNTIDMRDGIPLLTAKQLAKSAVVDGKEWNGKYLLMIDDLGHEPTEIVHYGMINTPIIDILESRYFRMCYTVITTNLRACQFREKYKGRIADRFNEMVHFIEMKDESYRE